jgi:hypothetical protein
MARAASGAKQAAANGVIRNSIQIRETNMSNKAQNKDSKKNGGHNGFVWSQRVVVYDGPGGFGR